MGRITTRRRNLGNIFASDALRHSLPAQKEPLQLYHNPFLDEPSTKNIEARNFEFRKMHSGDVLVLEEVEVVDTAPDLYLVKGKGKGKGGSYSSKGSKSKSKGRSKASQASKSKMTSKGKGKGGSVFGPVTDHPTFSPTTTKPPNLTASPAPTVTPELSERPTCAPNGGVFPPDVSDFFQAPSGGERSDLQQELDNALKEIQVPTEFQEQCVRR